MENQTSPSGLNPNVVRINPEQQKVLAERFLEAIRDMPKGMADGWIGDPEAFHAYIHSTILGAPIKRPEKYYIARKGESKILDIEGWRKYIRKLTCPECEELLSGHFEFRQKESSNTYSEILWFDKKQSIYPICGNCGMTAPLGGGRFAYRYHHTQLGHRTIKAREAFQRLIPLLDSPDPNEPKWFTTFREEITDLRYYFTAKSVVMDGASASGELQEIKLGNLMIFLEGLRGMKIPKKYVDFKKFRDNLISRKKVRA